MDVCNELTQKGQSARGIFTLLLQGLFVLDGSPLPSETAAAFLLFKLLGIAGYEPRLDVCAVCAKPIDVAYFNAKAGGAACQNCGGTAMSASALYAMRAIKQMEVSKISSVRMEAWLAREILELLSDHMHHFLNKRFKTYGFFHRIIIKGENETPGIVNGKRLY